MQSIELSWVEHMLGKKGQWDAEPAVGDYQGNFVIKLRADGPTKVLEVREDFSDKEAAKGAVALAGGSKRRFISDIMKDEMLKR